jgi:hypothetical protein
METEQKHSDSGTLGTMETRLTRFLMPSLVLYDHAEPRQTDCSLAIIAE